MPPRQPIPLGDIWQTLQTIGFWKIIGMVFGVLAVSIVGYITALNPAIILTIGIVVSAAFFCTAVAILKIKQQNGRSIPMVIFDERGSVIVNGGAMEYITDIHVERDQRYSYPATITISLNQHLATAPFISMACVNSFHFEARRGDKYDWIYDLRVIHYQTDPVTNRFRLEIFR